MGAALTGNIDRYWPVPTPGNFYVNLLPRLFLGYFSPTFPRFSPYFHRSLRLAPKTQENGTKTTRKNVRKFFLSYRNGDKDEDRTTTRTPAEMCNHCVQERDH